MYAHYGFVFVFPYSYRDLKTKNEKWQSVCAEHAASGFRAFRFLFTFAFFEKCQRPIARKTTDFTQRPTTMANAPPTTDKDF